MQLFFFILTVSPRWALASYSCIYGRLEFINDMMIPFTWRLKFNFSNDQMENQSINIVNIHKYPQVNHFIQIIRSNSIEINLYIQQNDCIHFRQNSNIPCILEMWCFLN